MTCFVCDLNVKKRLQIILFCALVVFIYCTSAWAQVYSKPNLNLNPRLIENSKSPYLGAVESIYRGKKSRAIIDLDHLLQDPQLLTEIEASVSQWIALKSISVDQTKGENKNQYQDLKKSLSQRLSQLFALKAMAQILDFEIEKANIQIVIAPNQVDYIVRKLLLKWMFQFQQMDRNKVLRLNSSADTDQLRFALIQQWVAENMPGDFVLPVEIDWREDIRFGFDHELLVLQREIDYQQNQAQSLLLTEGISFTIQNKFPETLGELKKMIERSLFQSLRAKYREQAFFALMRAEYPDLFEKNPSSQQFYAQFSAWGPARFPFSQKKINELYEKNKMSLAKVSELDFEYTEVAMPERCAEIYSRTFEEFYAQEQNEKLKKPIEDFKEKKISSKDFYALLEKQREQIPLHTHQMTMDRLQNDQKFFEKGCLNDSIFLNKKSEKIISNPFVLNRSNQDDRYDASISSSQIVKSFYEQVVGSFEMKQKLIPYQGVLLNGVVHYFFFHTISHKREYFLSAEDSRVRSYLMNVYVKDRLQELSSQMFKHLFERQCRIEVSPTYFDLKLFGGQLFDQLQISAFVAQPQLWLDSFFKIPNVLSEVYRVY